MKHCVVILLLCIWGASGQFLGQTRGQARGQIHGQSREEVRGQVLRQTIPEELSQDLLPPFEEVKSDDPGKTQEVAPTVATSELPPLPLPATSFVPAGQDATIATSELPPFSEPPQASELPKPPEPPKPQASRSRSRSRIRTKIQATASSTKPSVDVKVGSTGRDQVREQRKSTTPSQIAEEPSVTTTTTLKPIEYETPSLFPVPPPALPAPAFSPPQHSSIAADPSSRRRTYEAVSPDNFKLSPALPDGSYKFSFNLLESGIQRQEEGNHQQSQVFTNSSGPLVNGGYTYSAPDGQIVSVQYVADEFGFRPVGSHIPEIPEAIKRALKYLQSKANQDES
ncbi:zyxin-like [Lutzomyia longipalpis]|uniref:zyxin-like n=1 Tax=Lutzomyia longipalpis TaxID=7200 RepID=UPI00248366A6|nr:zyxin-like [Lutzomyia longipalpis]